jgi:hypothetical protein
LLQRFDNGLGVFQLAFDNIVVKRNIFTTAEVSFILSWDIRS